MTAIAYRDGVMAADDAATNYDARQLTKPMITRLPDGTLIGVAAAPHATRRVRQSSGGGLRSWNRAVRSSHRDREGGTVTRPVAQRLGRFEAQPSSSARCRCDHPIASSAAQNSALVMPPIPLG